jgi:hypothetical protein
MMAFTQREARSPSRALSESADAASESACVSACAASASTTNSKDMSVQKRHDKAPSIISDKTPPLDAEETRLSAKAAKEAEKSADLARREALIAREAKLRAMQTTIERLPVEWRLTKGENTEVVHQHMLLLREKVIVAQKRMRQVKDSPGVPRGYFEEEPMYEMDEVWNCPPLQAILAAACAIQANDVLDIL